MSLRTLCLVVLLNAAITRSPAQTFNKLVNFTYANGAAPSNARLVQGPDGDLYGTTVYGGNCSLYDLGCGTIFKMTPAGKLTTLHVFSGPDGAFPFAGLVFATDGAFYGATEAGGANCSASTGGCGTVFRMNRSGTLTTLHSFCAQANCADGYEPFGTLVQAANGKLYGTTLFGGASASSTSLGCGTVFEVTLSGTVTTLASFFDQSGGCTPEKLMQATNGDFYGTTLGGTVFKVTPQGQLTTLYTFCSQANCADGEVPVGGVMEATDGNLYGVTELGGNTLACTGGCGTVFQLTPGGKLTTVHSFAYTDGYTPFAGLMQATDGNLYGSTLEGGYTYTCPGGCGNIFEITTSGTFTILYSMTPQNKEAFPASPLMQATDGTFYGNTYIGGYDSAGTVFSLSTGLGPFVKAIPDIGKVGTAVKILGTDLTGATSVTFNGTAAAFQVIGASEISTTVPAGATTGTLEVVTPAGTLSSRIAFGVRQ